MSKLMTTAAAVLMASAGVAEAARLTTASAYLDDYNAQCRIAYFGSSTNVKVTITAIGYATSSFPQRYTRIVKLGPNNRGGQLALSCSPAGGVQDCQDMRCVFDVANPQEPTANFVAGACGRGLRYATPGAGDCLVAK